MKKTILISGATGFVGTQVVKDLIGREVELYLLVRDDSTLGFTECKDVHLIRHDSIEKYQGEGLPDKVDAIVHLVAKAHVTEDESQRDEYEKVNVKGTEALAKIAVQKRVDDFIYLSSIKVNGEETGEKGFSELDPASPQGIYAETKYKAEQVAGSLAANGIRVSIVRIPLVYGRGVKANMAALVKMVKSFPVIPFGAIDNSRSLISVRNLSHFIMTLLFEKALLSYDSELFLISDKEPVSTAKMCAMIANALKRKIMLLSVPKWCLQSLLIILGRREQWNKLAGNLEVNGVNAKRYFNWSAPYLMSDELLFLVELDEKSGIKGGF